MTEGIVPRPEGREAFFILAAVRAVPEHDELVSVNLFFRVGFDPAEFYTPMLDDGVYPDAKRVRPTPPPDGANDEWETT